MKLSEKNIKEFFKTLIEIIENRENVEIKYEILKEEKGK
jgi:cell division FtsZ-interacting protein ZapD